MIVRPRTLATRPTVSVVIPCYNYGHYLPLAIASALDQEGVTVDVLVVDDCSTDDSAEVALRLAAQDSRVKVLIHEENAGHIATYNDGLARAEGDYLVLLSADDALPRNALTRAVTLMEHHPTVGLVYGFSATFCDEPHDVADRTRSWSVWNGQRWMSRLSRQGRNVIRSPEVVMRREAWLEAGPYDSRLPHAADMYMWLRTALSWNIGRINGPAQALYRVHGDNMHMTTFAGAITDLRERALVFDLLFAEGRHPQDHLTELHDAARRALSRRALNLAIDAGGSGRPVADELAEFAVASWRPARESQLWDGYRNGRSSAGALLVRRLTQDMTSRLVWHRWRRYGI